MRTVLILKVSWKKIGRILTEMDKKWFTRRSGVEERGMYYCYTQKSWCRPRQQKRWYVCTWPRGGWCWWCNAKKSSCYEDFTFFEQTGTNQMAVGLMGEYWCLVALEECVRLVDTDMRGDMTKYETDKVGCWLTWNVEKVWLTERFV